MLHKIIFNKPAACWEEALPLGNGRLGCTVFGGTDKLRLNTNEITLWSGEPYPDADRPFAYKHLDKLRELIDGKQYKKAEELLNREFTNQGGGFNGAYSPSYQTFGDIFINFTGRKQRASDYRRELDLDNAVCRDSYIRDGSRINREYFCSHPDDALFLKISGEEKASLSMDISYRRKDIEKLEATGDTLNFEGHCDKNPSHMYFAGRLKVFTEGGRTESLKDEISVRNADTVYIVFTCATDYIPDASAGFKGADPVKKCRDITDRIDIKDYEKIKKEHIEDYRSFYDRSSLSIAEEKKERTVTELLSSYRKDNSDRTLPELFFCFGKYLFISCSREDNMLPANLQGLWCDSYEPPWHCDYHVNINLQMNYWPAGPFNIIEGTKPLADFICALKENGSRTARAYYNAPGWTLYTISNPWFWTSPGWSDGWAQYPLGGAWMCSHLVEYYNFTGDKKLLEGFYDVLKENCLFNMNMIYRDENGYIITNPATSPENTFRDDSGNTGWVCRGTAMDIEMLYENFVNMAYVCDVLGRDSELKEKLLLMISQLRPLKTGRAGQLLEWEGDWDMNAPEMHHRHVSHLYGLHPGTMISPEKTPELAEGCRRSLELRGDEGTGWSLAWKINFYARLYDGNHALKLLDRLLKPTGKSRFMYVSGGGVYPNLFDAHPPFQIDGNFGAAAGICEMLLQSHVKLPDGSFLINLLPALPDRWREGSFTRFLARGNTEVSAFWKDSILLKAKVKSLCGGRIAIKGRFSAENNIPVEYKDGVTYIDAVKNTEYILLPERI